MKKSSKVIITTFSIVGAIAGFVFYIVINLMVLPFLGGHFLFEALFSGDINADHLILIGVLIGGGALLGCVVGALITLVVSIFKFLFGIK